MTIQRFKRSVAAACMACVLLLGAAPVAADEYDPQEAGHPLRILGYELHPVGVILDLLIARPAHWLVSQPGLDEFFGHEPYDD